MKKKLLSKLRIIFILISYIVFLIGMTYYFDLNGWIMTAVILIPPFVIIGVTALAIKNGLKTLNQAEDKEY